MENKANFKRLHIGTSGWSYRHWSGNFYPKELRPDKYLEYYITKFSCVELNSCFYRLPLEGTVTGWKDRTPETFRWCTKLNRIITHDLKLVNVEDPLENYFNAFEGMKNRLGPVLVQLPPGITFSKSLICGFLDILKEFYNQYRFAIEVRHSSWINDDFFDLLLHYGIGFVIADSGDRYPYYEKVTTDFVYLRFHGRETLYASDYNETDLQFYATKMTNWLNDNKEVWAFFNNDYFGFAIKNALRLKQLLDKV
jgi:uncharacterized protein YecE (DUF72 family)